MNEKVNKYFLAAELKADRLWKEAMELMKDMEELKFHPRLKFNQAFHDKAKLELSICDPDIAEAYSKLMIGDWSSGDALRMQIARSLKELVEILKGVVG